MFKNKLNDEIFSLPQESYISLVTADTHAEVLASILTNTANHAIPKTTPRKTIPQYTPKAWWTNKCQNKWRTKKAAKGIYLKKSSPTTYLSKLQAEANLKRTIINA